MSEKNNSRSTVLSLLLATLLALPLWIRLLCSKEIELLDAVVETYRVGLVNRGLSLYIQTTVWSIPEVINTEWTENPYSVMKVVLGVLFVLKGSMAVLLIKFM